MLIPIDPDLSFRMTWGCVQSPTSYYCPSNQEKENFVSLRFISLLEPCGGSWTSQMCCVECNKGKPVWISSPSCNLSSILTQQRRQFWFPLPAPRESGSKFAPSPPFSVAHGTVSVRYSPAQHFLCDWSLSQALGSCILPVLTLQFHREFDIHQSSEMSPE